MGLTISSRRYLAGATNGETTGCGATQKCGFLMWPAGMMIIYHEGVAMLTRRMLMGMAVRLRPFPAFMGMLMVLVVIMPVNMRECFVAV